MIMRCRMAHVTALALVAGCGLILSAATSGANEIPKEYQDAIQKQLQTVDKGVAEGPYKADWDDLKRHDAAPEWFRDAKFGIYWHWGVYSVPAYGSEWYPRNMHLTSGRRSVYKHHAETYGEPDTFGYHDFVPKFKAEKFDAEAWADLLKKAGARYAGPVCEHHDGFSMWDSAITPWNAADKGPGRDITGELEKAIRARGMRFVTTFHHARTRNWYPRPEDEPNWPTHTTDPELRMLYANVSEDLFNRIWLTKLGEAIDKYKPDLIWFDGKLEDIGDPYHQRFLAYYFNQAKQWGRDVVVTTKGHDYPAEVAVEDFEKGRMNRLTDFCWLTDDTISMGSWCYTTNLKIKSTAKVLHDFIDIVSKNGCLLLNISPMADGSIPEVQQNVLLGMGKWLRTCGEAIFDTRPWLAFGEGPTRLRKGGGFVGHVTYTAKDLRYTRSKDGKAVYAVALGWPEDDALTLTAVQVDGDAGGKVTLLGRDGSLPYSVNADKQLVINVSAVKKADLPCEHAYAFKLTGLTTSLSPKAAIGEAPAAGGGPARSTKPTLSKDLLLDATEAGLTGRSLRLESKGGDTKNIGHWNHDDSKAVWKVEIPKKGTYRIRAVVATTGASHMTIEAAGKTLTVAVPKTGSWTDRKTVDAGAVTFEKPGTHEVVARPVKGKWKAVNLWQLELTPAE